ncbi:hypothetical protein AAGS40_24245 [Paraburkholderia sp. PREW-6R]|uniref:hypothetical protein n=1 Tax=Paraburkholderia sp. PREW-6R TaxID=3141544 RepID=UPI0031F4D619
MKLLVARLSRGACLVGALLAGGNALASNACNKIPVQPRSTQSIGRDMIVNGVPTSLVGMDFAGTLEEVSNAFRDFWVREDVPAKGRSTSSGWLLSALDDHCLYVLALAPQVTGDHARGLMSVIRLGGDEPDHTIPDAVIPLPEDSRVVSDVESRDPDKAGRTWILDMSGEAQWNAQRYRNSLAAQGWISVGQQPDVQSARNHATHATAFAMQRGRDSVDASFSDSAGRTSAVINAIRTH